MTFSIDLGNVIFFKFVFFVVKPICRPSLPKKYFLNFFVISKSLF